MAKLCASKGEARRLIRQGGAYVDNRALSLGDETVPVAGAPWLKTGQAVLRAGKKRYMTVRVS